MKSFKEFLLENPTMGVNIRDDKDNHYADDIIDGHKTLESRRSDSLRPYVGKRVGVVRTGVRGEKATAIGHVEIGEPIIADEKKFEELRHLHKVPKGSKYDIKPGETKHLYPMIDPKRFDKPHPVSHGIVARKIKYD